MAIPPNTKYFSENQPQYIEIYFKLPFQQFQILLTYIELTIGWKI